MITLTATPASVCYSLHPVFFRLQCAHNGANFGGVPAFSTLTFHASPEIGDTFTLSFRHRGEFLSVSFSVVQVGSVTLPTHLPDASGLGGVAAWVAIMNNHPLVASFVTVTYSESGQGEPQLTITALEIDTIVSWGYVTADASHTNTPAESDVRPANYTLRAAIYARSGDMPYRLIATLYPTPDAQGVVTLDIQDAIHAAMLANMPLCPVFSPHATTTTPIDVAWVHGDFFLKITESYTENNTSQSASLTTPTYRTRLGGFSRNLETVQVKSNNIVQPYSILHYAVNNPMCHVQRPELHFTKYEECVFVPVTAANTPVLLELTIVAYSNEGAMTHQIQGFQIGTVAAHTTVLIPFSFQSIAQHFPYGTNIQRDIGRVSILIANTAYIVLHQVRDSSPVVRYLSYLNEFGIPQILRCDGTATRQKTVTRQTAERVTVPYDISDRNAAREQLAAGTAQSGATSELTLQYNTLAMSKEHFEAHAQILESEYVAEIGAEGFLPLSIVTKNASVSETSKHRYALTIEATPRPANLRHTHYQDTRFVAISDRSEQEDGQQMTLYYYPFV